MSDAPLNSAELAPEERLLLDLDGFDGPIDLLLTLARDQKVDLKAINVLALCEQYLAFIAQARRLRLEIAADYLVMAAWLVYLKSRLLLPEPPKEDEPEAVILAEDLAFQLARLEAMQKSGQRLFSLPRLGVEVFGGGDPEGLDVELRPVWSASLYDLLKAYADHRQRIEFSTLTIAPTRLYAMEDALEFVLARLGRSEDWGLLWNYLPDDLKDPLVTRSAFAAAFAASLELARNGKIDLRQTEAFGPILIRARTTPQPHELSDGAEAA